MGATARLLAAAAVVLTLGACSSTVPGEASAADTGPTSSSSSSSSSRSPSPSPSPSAARTSSAAPTSSAPAPPVVSEAEVCAGLGFGLITANAAWLDWWAATEAGQQPAQSAEQVAAEYDAAVAEGRPLVSAAPPGAVRDAAEALLAAATAMSADLRAGGRGTDAGLVPASDALEAACPD
ncbi:hypothetical protein [Modestobacter versicolor]|uniref:DUF4439 domain-containing protein n=1 Tax=Modestobacter versicolor TaxID=429133 RepID=A0A323V5U9_9ACTN|nr:hypothetical protein [Modestobacter versicolor]MBB3675798.1 hypothetical protein [Modestobacter versicolor]PZA20209.1 hypothetical protein DMO24_16675 [Modestobacter versicolor]